jgi:polysaccharide export outer membrane protein
MNRRISILAIALALAFAGGARASQQDKKGDAKSAAPAPADATSAVAATNDPDYVIGAEDVLDVSVWKEPDVSRSVPVRPDGRISLPLINDVPAAGLTPQQLAASVTEKLRKFMNEPQVTIIVTAINSQRVFIVGEVNRAGAVPLIPGMTVLQALSSAGGFTAYANMRKIHIVRIRDGKQIQLPFNYKGALKGDGSQQNIRLEPGDTIVVP